MRGAADASVPDAAAAAAPAAATARRAAPRGRAPRATHRVWYQRRRQRHSVLLVVKDTPSHNTRVQESGMRGCEGGYGGEAGRYSTLDRDEVACSVGTHGGIKKKKKEKAKQHVPLQCVEVNKIIRANNWPIFAVRYFTNQ